MSRYDYDDFDDYDFYDYDFDDYDPRKKGGVKTALIITLIILLCLSVAGAFLHATGLTHQNVSIGGVLGGSDDEFNGEVDTPAGENELLKEPTNASTLMARSVVSTSCTTSTRRALPRLSKVPRLLTSSARFTPASSSTMSTASPIGRAWR